MFQEKEETPNKKKNGAVLLFSSAEEFKEMVLFSSAALLCFAFLCFEDKNHLFQQFKEKLLEKKRRQLFVSKKKHKGKDK